ncbi:MAG: hypothetical protein J6O17_05035 [Eubacterium sp.]|nr:hypothetical protein [Eubacterium sp.]
MNNHLFDITMLAIMVPMAVILYFYYYPKKWADRKLIFGVRNREEFKNLDVVPKVDEIVDRNRKIAKIILICSLVIMALLWFIPDFTLRMMLWSFFVMLDIVFIIIPFVRGNGEMKTLKKEIGLNSKGVSYTDFTNAGAVHALKLSNIIIPNIVGAMIIIASLLFDAGVIRIGGKAPTGDYANTFMLASFLFIGLMMIPIAILIDRMRNEVISDDSDINANFNRAKKKNWADTNTSMTWVNTIFIAICFVAITFFINSDMVYLGSMIVYMVILMVCIGVYAKRNLAIDARYRRETSIEVDDDDLWILGSIYYNPDDKRLNVEKRMGMGATVNMAHPVGKLIGIIGVLAIIYTFAVLIWAGALSKSAISVRVENGNIICHHSKDEYVIPIGSIEDLTFGEGAKDLNIRRTSGYEMPPVIKGKCTVEGERGCIVFINYDADKYLKFTYDGTTYYISGGTAEETENVYQQLIK